MEKRSVKKIFTTFTVSALTLIAALGALMYRSRDMAAEGEIPPPEAVLEPEGWKGKPFPLLWEMDEGEELRSGRWTVLLYHHDCPRCDEARDRLRHEAHQGQRQGFAFVEVPPYEGPSDDAPSGGGPVLIARLPDDRDWFVRTPAVLELDDGVVTRVEVGEEPQAVRPHARRQSRKSRKDSRGNSIRDLGYIEPGSTHELSFSLGNPLGVPLRLSKVRSECACTRVTKAPEEIAPAGSAELHATFIAPQKPARYSKRVLVETHSPELPKITLLLTARIGLPLRVEPEILDLGPLLRSSRRQGEFSVANDGPEPLKLLYGTCDQKGAKLRVPRAPIAPGSMIRLPVSVTCPKETSAGHQKLAFHIRTNAATQRTLSARVNYIVAE